MYIDKFLKTEWMYNSNYFCWNRSVLLSSLQISIIIWFMVDRQEGGRGLTGEFHNIQNPFSPPRVAPCFLTQEDQAKRTYYLHFLMCKRCFEENDASLRPSTICQRFVVSTSPIRQWRFRRLAVKKTSKMLSTADDKNRSVEVSLLCTVFKRNARHFKWFDYLRMFTEI